MARRREARRGERSALRQPCLRVYKLGSALGIFLLGQNWFFQPPPGRSVLPSPSLQASSFQNRRRSTLTRTRRSSLCMYVPPHPLFSSLLSLSLSLSLSLFAPVSLLPILPASLALSIPIYLSLLLRVVASHPVVLVMDEGTRGPLCDGVIRQGLMCLPGKGRGCSWQLSKVDISVTGVIGVSYILCPASP